MSIGIICISSVLRRNLYMFTVWYVLNVAMYNIFIGIDEGVFIREQILFKIPCACISIQNCSVIDLNLEYEY